jgi:hypothetical protein
VFAPAPIDSCAGVAVSHVAQEKTKQGAECSPFVLAHMPIGMRLIGVGHDTVRGAVVRPLKTATGHGARVGHPLQRNAKPPPVVASLRPNDRPLCAMSQYLAPQPPDGRAPAK